MWKRKSKDQPKSDTNMSNSVPEKVTIQDMRGADPFMMAKREWNERYGDYISRARNWRLMALMLGLISIVLAAGTVYIGSQNKMVPYIVEVDKLGQVVNVSQANEIQPAGKRVIQAMLMRFTIDFRSVSLDAVVQKAATDRLYKMVPQGSAALAKINDHYRESSPFVMAQSSSISIEPIGTPLPLSEQSWQIEWWETKRSLTGMIQSRKRYKAVAMIAFNPPKEQTQAFDLDNPIGLFVTDLNWSEQL
ncbi:VirB8/TrbF family protein [Alicycliphilus denitrificans]|uniref:VirB8/TrbF family protein n=1 Tax=Alicycliphilus denitrificans TaxID=179636 RepID=UPI00384EDF70